MPRDARDRITEAPVVEGQLPATAEEREAAEEDRRNPVFADGRTADQLAQHELPPQARQAPAFTYEELILRGLDDATAIKIMREITAKSNGGLVEYDEDAEAERLHKTRQQAHAIAMIDGGNPVQLQLSQMEQYFAGAIPRGAPGDKDYPQYCRRYPYTSPQDEVVGVNGYIFRIPRFKRVNLPEEVIDILEKAAQAKEKFDVISAAYQARQSEPIYMRPDMPAEYFHQQQAAGFPVKEGFVNTSDSVWPAARG